MGGQQPARQLLGSRPGDVGRMGRGRFPEDVVEAASIQAAAPPVAAAVVGRDALPDDLGDAGGGDCRRAVVLGLGGGAVAGIGAFEAVVPGDVGREIPKRPFDGLGLPGVRGGPVDALASPTSCVSSPSGSSGLILKR